MKKIIPLMILVAVAGCKKEKENSTFVINFQKLLGKYLVCDSIKTKINNVTTVQPIGRGNGYDVTYNADASYTIYTNPQQVKYFQLTPPDKLYFYDDVYDPNQYYNVTTVTESKLVVERADTGRKIYHQIFYSAISSFSK